MNKGALTAFFLIMSLGLGIGYILLTELVGTQQIEALPRKTAAELQTFTAHEELARCLALFTPVSLPLRFKSDPIKYGQWPLIPAELSGTCLKNPSGKNGSNGGPGAGLTGTAYGTMTIDTGNGSLEINSGTVERKKPRAFYMPYLTNQFAAVLILEKVYNDAARIKQLHITLATLGPDGNVIDRRLLGSETIRYDKDNDEDFEHYLMLQFNKDFTIELATKTWRFVESYSTSGWTPRTRLSVNPAGRISVVPEKKLQRDE